MKGQPVIVFASYTIQNLKILLPLRLLLARVAHPVRCSGYEGRCSIQPSREQAAGVIDACVVKVVVKVKICQLDG